MYWTSVKNLLIAMLVAANIFLICFISIQDRNRSYISEDELEDAVEILSGYGMSVESPNIPLRRFDGDIYESFYRGDEAYYTGVAESLTGKSSESMHILQLPDGGARILVESGEIVESIELTKDFSFAYVCDNKAEIVAYTDITVDNFNEKAALYDSMSGSNLKALSKKATDFLRSNSQDESQITVGVEGGFVDLQKGLSYVLLSQRIGGEKIFRHSLVCVFEKDALIAAYGRWYFEDIADRYDYELYDQVNILFTNYSNLTASVENDDSEKPLPIVSAVYPCYSTYMNSEKTALYFIPSWQVEHSDGRVIVYNAAQNIVYYRSDE